MEQQIIQGHDVKVFKTYNGTKLFITDQNGIQIYAHKLGRYECRNPFWYAQEIIARSKRCALCKKSLANHEDGYHYICKKGLESSNSLSLKSSTP